MKKDQILIFIKNLNPFFIARVALLFVFVVAILILKSQITTLAKKTNHNQMVFVGQQQLIDQASELKKQYNEVYALVPRISALLPNQDNLPRFVADVEGAATKAGLDHASVTFGGDPFPSSASPNAKEIVVALSAAGVGVTFNDFLKAIATLPYFFSITSITIDAQGGLNGTSLMKATGTLFLR